MTMNIIWGVILFIITSIAYIGQIITVFWPMTAVRLGLVEPEADVDPIFFADVRGEALWDVVVLWTLPLAGILLAFNNPAWVYLGLVGGGMYLYFAGRGIIVRKVMQRSGIRIGKSDALKSIFLFLTIWGLAGAATNVLAIVSLSQP